MHNYNRVSLKGYQIHSTLGKPNESVFKSIKKWGSEHQPSKHRKTAFNNQTIWPPTSLLPKGLNVEIIKNE